MESAARARIRNRLRLGVHDHHGLAVRDAAEEVDHVGVRHADAAVRGRPAECRLVVRAVDVDVALERIAARAAIDPFLEPLEREHPAQDQVLGAGLPAPHRAGGLPAIESRSRLGAFADALMDAVPARRGAQRAVLAPHAGGGGGDGVAPHHAPALDQLEALAGDVHQDEALGQLTIRRARASQGLAGEGGAGIGCRGGMRHGRSLCHSRPRRHERHRRRSGAGEPSGRPHGGGNRSGADPSTGPVRGASSRAARNAVTWRRRALGLVRSRAAGAAWIRAGWKRQDNVRWVAKKRGENSGWSARRLRGDRGHGYRARGFVGERRPQARGSGARVAQRSSWVRDPRRMRSSPRGSTRRRAG